eukprot:scaffold3805_cov63-Phaeocystis_antarctica.AAC.2
MAAAAAGGGGGGGGDGGGTSSDGADNASVAQRRRTLACETPSTHTSAASPWRDDHPIDPVQYRRAVSGSTTARL